ncbi:unnamed protein product [Lactuca virosa]|uniref:Uncharacterized protein n=1 Tax=Lactuca virosa TaxID=75947 RepID=A0AAU9NSJ7_9ASTR|nr:unnamed protein product [Lactuca virosa]
MEVHRDFVQGLPYVVCVIDAATRLGCLSVFVAAMEDLIRRQERNNHSGTTIRVQLFYSRPIAPLLPLPCVVAAPLPSSGEPSYPRSSSSAADVVDVPAMDFHHC